MIEFLLRTRWTSRLVGAGLIVGAVTGCGQVSTAARLTAGALSSTFSPSPPAETSPSPSPAPSPSATAFQTPTAPPPSPPAPATLRFPLLAVSEPVAGQVVITPGSGSYQLSVNVSGLPPGTVHSVHLHFGSCPSTGVHLAVLGSLVADAGGVGSMTVTIARPYSGSGRFVIVYAGPSAGALAGCAQLG